MCVFSGRTFNAVFGGNQRLQTSYRPSTSGHHRLFVVAVPIQFVTTTPSNILLAVLFT